MDLSLIYRALAERQVDLIAGDATSGLIVAYDLVMLRRQSALLSAVRRRAGGRAAAPAARSPRCGRPSTLAGRITVDDMRQMNRAVDAERQDPAAVARAFLSRLDRRGPA